MHMIFHSVLSINIILIPIFATEMVNIMRKCGQKRSQRILHTLGIIVVIVIVVIITVAVLMLMLMLMLILCLYFRCSITSFNEWGEGTQIEAARLVYPDEGYAKTYLDYGERGPFKYLHITDKYSIQLKGPRPSHHDLHADVEYLHDLEHGHANSPTVTTANSSVMIENNTHFTSFNGSSLSLLDTNDTSDVESDNSADDDAVAADTDADVDSSKEETETEDGMDTAVDEDVIHSSTNTNKDDDDNNNTDDSEPLDSELTQETKKKETVIKPNKANLRAAGAATAIDESHYVNLETIVDESVEDL